MHRGCVHEVVRQGRHHINFTAIECGDGGRVIGIPAGSHPCIGAQHSDCDGTAKICVEAGAISVLIGG